MWLGTNDTNDFNKMCLLSMFFLIYPPQTAKLHAKSLFSSPSYEK